MSKHRLETNTPHYNRATGRFEYAPSRARNVLTAVGRVATHAPIMPVAITSALFLGGESSEPAPSHTLDGPSQTIEGRFVSPPPPEATDTVPDGALVPVNLTPTEPQELPEKFRFLPPEQ